MNHPHEPTLRQRRIANRGDTILASRLPYHTALHSLPATLPSCTFNNGYFYKHCSRLTHLFWGPAPLVPGSLVSLSALQTEPHLLTRLNLLKKSLGTLKTILSIGGPSYIWEWHRILFSPLTWNDFFDSLGEYLEKGCFDGFEIYWNETLPPPLDLDSKVTPARYKEQAILFVKYLSGWLDSRAKPYQLFFRSPNVPERLDHLPLMRMNAIARGFVVDSYRLSKHNLVQHDSCYLQFCTLFKHYVWEGIMPKKLLMGLTTVGVLYKGKYNDPAHEFDLITYKEIHDLQKQPSLLTYLKYDPWYKGGILEVQEPLTLKDLGKPSSKSRVRETIFFDSKKVINQKITHILETSMAGVVIGDYTLDVDNPDLSVMEVCLAGLRTKGLDWSEGRTL
jgi:hypothetical protein